MNETKTEQVMFSIKKSKKSIPGITLNGTTTVASPSAKYLGMHLDKKLLYSKDINETRIKIRKLTNQEIRIIHKLEDKQICIDEITCKFYQERLRHIPILNSIMLCTKEHAPFKLKHKLPYHILM